MIMVDVWLGCLVCRLVCFVLIGCFVLCCDLVFLVCCFVVGLAAGLVCLFDCGCGVYLVSASYVGCLIDSWLVLILFSLHRFALVVSWIGLLLFYGCCFEVALRFASFVAHDLDLCCVASAVWLVACGWLLAYFGLVLGLLVVFLVFCLLC